MLFLHSIVCRFDECKKSSFLVILKQRCLTFYYLFCGLLKIYYDEHLFFLYVCCISNYCSAQIPYISRVYVNSSYLCSDYSFIYKYNFTIIPWDNSIIPVVSYIINWQYLSIFFIILSFPDISFLHFRAVNTTLVIPSGRTEHSREFLQNISVTQKNFLPMPPVKHLTPNLR